MCSRRQWTKAHYTYSLVLLFIPLLIGSWIGEIRAPHFFLHSNLSGDEVHIKPQNSWDKIWDIAGLLPAALTSEYDGILSKLTARELFETFPSPASADTVQIYNERSYHELIQTFMTTKTNITICANGGSVTAGAHIKAESDRYYSKLANYISELNLNAAGGAVRMIGRGHGTRNSLHSAVFAPNFFPQNTDLFLWEFSINDGQHGYNNNKRINRRDSKALKFPNEIIIEQERSIFIAWLREVEKMRPTNPPKVILIYLWRTPFAVELYSNQQGRIKNPVYNAHAQLAKEFDFVVGHVNVASYFDELGMKKNDLKELFLADRLHPSATGHLAIAFLLLDLIRGKERDGMPRSEIRKDAVVPSKRQQQPPLHKWLCGTESEAKRFVQSQVVEYGDDNDGIFSRWRSPLGTATLETPRNDAVSGSRQMFFEIASSEEVQILGKQDPLRMDRQGSTPLSCCNAGASISDYTTVRVPENDEPIQNARSIFFGFGPGLSDVKALRIYIDSDKEHVNGKLIHVVDEDWKCFWSWKDVYDPMWFAFTEEHSEISSMRICVENDRCDEDRIHMQEQSEAMLMSIAVY